MRGWEYAACRNSAVRSYRVGDVGSATTPSSEVEYQVRRAIGAKCQELDVEVIALGGVEDHVHLLIKLPPTVTLAEVVKQVKGASSHLVTHAIHHGSDFFKWQGAYGAVSIAPSALHDVAEYIKQQPIHHAAHYLNPDWEPPTKPEP